MEITEYYKSTGHPQLDERTERYYKYRERKLVQSEFVKYGYDIGVTRYYDEHPDYPLIDISYNVKEDYIALSGGGISIFTPGSVQNNDCCIFYIHGGSFISGGLIRSRNVVKYMASQARCPVIFIHYGLAPESDYEQITNQCLSLIYETADKSESLGISTKKAGLIGDSAGGNIALACSYLDSQQRNVIDFQSIIYPVVDISEHSGDYWSLEHYGENISDAGIACIKNLKGEDKKFRKLYMQEKTSDTNPIVSPIYHKDLSAFPRTFLATAEFDYLRIQGELFGLKLKKSGVQTKIIRYNGVAHAFMDKIGYFEQSKEVIDDMVGCFLEQIL